MRERVRLRGGDFTDAITRVRSALDELRIAGDRRQYIASVPAFIETLTIDFPEEALKLAVDAAEQAALLGDVVSVGALAFAICDTALEAEDVRALERWLPELERANLDTLRRYEADVVGLVAGAAQDLSRPDPRDQLLALADRLVEIGDASGADTPEIAALCVPLWHGRSRDARDLFAHRVAAHLPVQMRTLCELVLRALEGPPWSLDTVDGFATTSLNNERALLHLLRGEQTEAELLFRERYADLLNATGSGHQRFSPYFPGALVAALGPPDTEPKIGWLLEWIHRPPFPGLWIAHRGICALLLSERVDPPEPNLHDAALRLLESTNADDAVREWIGERAERSASQRNRGV
jgi:hypothetical protein